MLYKKYQLFNGKIEVMIPSEFLFNQGGFELSEYNWTSVNEDLIIDCNLFENEDSENELTFLLQEYYLDYKRILSTFTCKHVIKKLNFDDEFGEMVYLSTNLGYRFYSCLNLAIVDGKILMLTMSCLMDSFEEYEHAFSNIADSIKILRKEGEADGSYD